MSISANFPNVFPSLELNFAQSQQLDPRVTFSRSTTAPYYDGKTSVLAEQNLVLQSQNAFNGANWTKTSCTATDASTIAPDGTTTASTLTGTAGGYTQYISPTNATSLGISSASTVTNTYSLHLKAGTISSVKFLIYNNTGGNQIFGTFDLTAITGVAGGTAMTPTVTIVDVGNSWRRVTVTGNLGGSVGQFAIPVIYADNGTFYMWGIQVEQRSSVTAYNATTTSAITNYIPQLLTAPINQPRFDFNPTTGESLGLLIEQSSTNLLTYSQDFSNAVWTKLSLNGTLNVTGGIAIDGTQSANLWQENTTASTQRVMYQTVSATSGVNYTLTVYAKQYAGGAKRWLCVYPQTAASGYAVFDLTLGTVTLTGGANYVSSSIAAAGNGFYRCSVTVVAASTASLNCNVYMQNTGSSAAAGYTGDGFSGIYIWGAQVEALAFPTSYIFTTSAQVTRASDNASMTGTNFSSWYNQAEGTLYAEASTVSNGNACVYGIGDSTSNIIRMFKQNGNQAVYQVVKDATFSANLGMATTWTSGYGKIASVYKTDDFATSYNGGTSVTDTSGAVPIVNTVLTIGIGAGVASLNGYIKKIAYYPIRVTNTQLQALTGS